MQPVEHHCEHLGNHWKSLPHLCRKKRTTGTSFLAFSAHLKAILGVPGYGTQIMYNVQKLKFTDQSRLSVAYCRAVATGTRPVRLC